MENKLEAVLLPITSQEIDSGRLEKFLNQFTSFTYSDLDIVICINNTNHKTPLIGYMDILNKVFKTVHILYINLSKEEDIYIFKKMSEVVPTYGYVSGPNLLFLFSIRNCKNYNTVLLLETDCILKPNWFEVTSNYVKYAGDFIISGAGYDGNMFVDVTNVDFHHVNGVAFYKTGNPDLYYLLDQVERYIIKSVNLYPILAYDIAINRTIHEKLKDIKTFHKWKVIARKVIKNTLIVNCSPSQDANITIKECNDNFPNHVILHKKF